MEKYLTWYLLRLKNHVKKKIFWMQLFLMFLVIFLISSYKSMNQKELTIGFMGNGSCYQERIEQILLEKTDSLFGLVRYGTMKELQDAVTSGKIECGFTLDSNSDVITYVCTPHSIRGEVAKETFFAAWFQVYSEEILKKADDEIYTNKNAKRLTDVIESYRKNLAENKMFHVEKQQIETKVISMKEAKIWPLQGMTGICVFMIMLLSHARRYSKNERAMEYALCDTERMIFDFMSDIAAGTIPAIMGTILISLSTSMRGCLKESLLMFVFLMYCGIWSLIVGRFQKDEISFAAQIMASVLVSILVCPVLLDVSSFVPVIRYIKYIVPLGIYI